MEDCTKTCDRAPGKQPVVQAPDRVLQAAETLACLLIDTSEFQNLVRLARAVRLDPQVNVLVNRINGFEMDYDSGSGAAAQQCAYEELQNQIEDLPLVRDYRTAETNARTIFGLVEDCISTTAGLAFAENAKPSACG